MVKQVLLESFQVEPEVHSVVARFRWRDGGKGEREGSKKGNLGREDKAGREKGQVKGGEGIKESQIW